MEYFNLNDGNKIPKLGFGAMIKGDEETESAVAEAISAGYRLIDTAAIYQNERAVGRGIKQSGIPRDQIFVTTKLWLQDTGYDATKREFEGSLERLGLDYVDLYLIHKPWGNTFDSWEAMQDLQKEGKIKSLGVSNFYPDQLMDLMVHHEVTPVIDQIENNPLFQQNYSVKFLNDNNVQPEAWLPFAHAKSGVLDNQTITQIAEEHNKQPGQVVLLWLLQRNVLPLVKSVHRQRMIDNLNVFDFELSDKEMNQIKSLDTHTSQFYDHRDPAAVKRISEWKANF